MFGRKTTTDARQTAPEPKLNGKGRPTPKRKDQEAARKQPLVPSNRKEASKRSREGEKQQRAKMREAMMTGDDRYLPAKDKGPQRRYARDYVDSRRSVGEYFLPIALVVVFFSFFQITRLSYVANFVLYAVFLVLIGDSIILGVSLNKALKRKFDQRERGLTFYAVMRNMQLRKLRLPKPMVGRGKLRG